MRHGYITNLILFYPAWSFSQSFRSLSFFQEIVWYLPPFYDWLSISCCLASRSKWFIPGSPLFNLFYSFVPGPVYWYPSQWNSTPNLDIHFWMSNPPPCWRVLFLEWPPPDWGHLLTSVFFLVLPFPLFPLPLARTWCVFIFVILKCLIGIVSSLFPRFPQTELFQSFNFSLFTFFLRLWLLLLYRQRCLGDLGTMDCVLAFMDLPILSTVFLVTHPSCCRWWGVERLQGQSWLLMVLVVVYHLTYFFPSTSLSPQVLSRQQGY